MLNKIASRNAFICATAIMAVATLSLALNMQGWRSRVPAFDLLTHIYNARNLIATGALPEHGDTGSYGSYKSAGTAWLMVPGMLLFADPRLADYPGTAFLHVAALVGIFLLARAYFGPLCGLLAVFLYGLSETGIFLAGSLWPNGRPEFFIWTVHLTTRWAATNNGRYLAAAAGVWAVGMQVDMALAPAFFIFPAVWLSYRPAIRIRPLLAALLVAFIVWWPYLRFESTRGFADIRSQLLLSRIRSTDYKEAWCNPNLSLLRVQTSPDGTVRREDPSLLDRVAAQWGAREDKLLSNFKPVAAVPGAGLLLFCAVICSFGVLGWTMRSRGGAATTPKIGALILSLVVPWAILFHFAEDGKPERFWWLWPLQAVVLAAFVTHVLPRLRAPRLVVFGSALLLAIIVAGSPFLLARVHSWASVGWAGPDAEEIRVADFIATRLAAEDRNRARIGYQILIYEFMAAYHITNPVYKVGAEFDHVLKHPYGITNESQCAEGFSPADEYRIVQTRPLGDDSCPRHYFDVRVSPDFRLLRRFDVYEVYGRSGWGNTQTATDFTD
jgi:hypothetical protein